MVVGLRPGIGFVTPVGSARQARADADGLADRVRRWEALRGAEHPGLPALLASSEAQRLICAVAGLRDPSAEAGDARLVPGLPAALVAEREPLRGEYRTWAGPVLVDADRVRQRADVRTLTEALARIPVLTDRLAVSWTEPDPGALPQLPAALVRSSVAGEILVSGSARADLARLEAVCRAAEHLLGKGESGLEGEGGPVVGAGACTRAVRALRRAGAGAAVQQQDTRSRRHRRSVRWGCACALEPGAGTPSAGAALVVRPGPAARGRRGPWRRRASMRAAADLCSTPRSGPSDVPQRAACSAPPSRRRRTTPSPSPRSPPWSGSRRPPTPLTPGIW
ncbi:hypothetical protein LUR56_17235 [Streptomyces sp. MT29]|nr:hypothetical protein [Streptomyces sp. MT29]